MEPAPVSIERGRRILPEARQISPEEIRRLRELNPEMRERDFARIQKISEAELVAAFVGAGSVRLRPDVEALLAGAPALGEVICLTRNEHPDLFVHGVLVARQAHHLAQRRRVGEHGLDIWP